MCRQLLSTMSSHIEKRQSSVEICKLLSVHRSYLSIICAVVCGHLRAFSSRSHTQAPKESDDDMADFLGPSSLCPSSSRVLYEILIVKLFLVSMGSFPTVCTCGRTFNWRDKGMDHSVGVWFWVYSYLFEPWSEGRSSAAFGVLSG